MSSQEPGKFQLFFWGGGEDGSAYYSQHLAVEFWFTLEPAKCKLATAIGMFNQDQIWSYFNGIVTLGITLWYV